jgi:hypothetical protein
LGYHPAEDQWLTAITVQPARAGLSDPEIQMIRGLIKWQMDALRGELTAPGTGQ